MHNLIAQVDLRDTFFGTDNEHAIKDYTYQGSDIGRLISTILPTALVIAGFILFLYMVFGGFLIISSAGNAKKTEEGQQALTNAIIGFALIFTSYWIIQIIEVLTGISIL
jgi:hypothetical protein